jgi:protein-disulfide isomerase
LSSLVKEDDHTKGAINATVTLVEYGEYECPYTGRAYPIVKEIQERLGDRLLFVFRNFPLTQIILMHNMLLKQLKQQPYSENSGKCMIICSNISNRWTMII